MTDADKISIMACMLPHRYFFECSCCCLQGGSVESSPPFSGLHLLLFITSQTSLTKRDKSLCWLFIARQMLSHRLGCIGRAGCDANDLQHAWSGRDIVHNLTSQFSTRAVCQKKGFKRDFSILRSLSWDS
jgi:hypothetical protein